MVPEPTFESYYGRPILKEPTWKTPDVPIYLWIGGVAGGSALLAEGAALSGLPGLERVTRLTAAGGAVVGTVALVHDLGRPERFLNMLRVFKPTSPLSVGSYILAPFSSFAGAAAASHVTGVAPRLGRLAGLGAAVFGPPLATYTAALFANTAIPVWHEAHRELPFVFGGSAAAAAGGTAMLLAPVAETGPAVRMAAVGAVAELGVSHRMEQRLGMLAEPYGKGLAGRLMRLSRALTVAGLGLSAVSAGASGRGRPWARRLAGASYSAGSLALRFAVFEAGRESARDPKYVVVPQRERIRAREEAARSAASETGSGTLSG
ncbi:Polysulfide reductase, NrfD [Nocardioides dokdonensis FR1436]|uniref:Polysulfide reductase, NrfD n=2 Tax=Nocardioides TaxID=1839 RepID=A0A1A9GPW7_9ACTN|nr:Polysulfide reductase, NrfD [Nocardioides dokdonensis FR1436]